jgi:dTDP-4-dehydrorhamnose 3,5-epimerase-like enzyme
MKMSRIETTDRGWFVGNFAKAAFQTDACEVSFRIHKMGELWPLHYQEKITEINMLVRGEMIMQGTKIIAGDIFIVYPFEIADPEFLTDCEVICVKIPGIKNDKIVVEKI